MSAIAIIPLIQSNDLIATCTNLLIEGSMSNQNESHGRLVQVQHLMRGHLRGDVANFDIMKGKFIHYKAIIKFYKFWALLILTYSDF